MRAVIQRVSQASVSVDGETVGQIGKGFCILLGIHETDTTKEVDWMVLKIAGLRVFEDDEGKMNRSLQDVEGAALVVSQFTLYGDCRKGRRPSFVAAARPEKAIPLYEDFCKRMEIEGIAVQTGEFGAKMEVSIVNDGPVTMIVESP
ncbi:MAG: D-tyrosyl-tRNA(Tyr) deacylase [Candidatus Omnitrophica bacterium]|nr:D-tyrosyl-tRNA(Tyr) deacylase [Candidatus Omnitrophota bacterium]MCA9425611.1 D-tyrosyl-tRNA(Tyr) deacylase [Candidatus Omnitrophota bacterium]MCA9434189.1 D-tyrosyl-tRNA(Tyr) deacylase [Candidatus Omnitrophota bacterium]MCA9444001.1 D-tyrosyl-tRNA(Tyr) deacylase [Candidatus Omnitrophota bacterium]MCB9768083.1 D-tyrosyl-tRNA(Tyr) deacylase [Candidatus Omnitrophota bacterium]